MDDQRDSQITPAPTLPRPGTRDGGQREVLDSFCRANRTWALRQAKRSYRHLPDGLREQAVDRALADLRAHVPSSTERRVLSAELAERLTAALRHVHVGWCLNESSALLRREGTEPVQPEVRRDELAGFVDRGLGGLERAVLQLEIGAGRDTRTSRAALRLHPRAYAQHRSAGLSKLRDAISASVFGRACDQHVAGVVDAAMGDRRAMDALASGDHRCRSCAREAQGLRSVLHERLAVAPWPLVVKPAGVLAAKVGAFGAIAGGKGAGVGAIAASSGGGSGATIAATVLAAATLATGTAAVVGSEPTPRESRASTPVTTEVRATATADRETTPRAITSAQRATRRGARVVSRAKDRRAGAQQPAEPAANSSPRAPAEPAPAPVTSVATKDAATNAANDPGAAKDPGSRSPAPARGPVASATKPVTDAVDSTVDAVATAIPPVDVTPVQEVVDGVTSTVDNAAGTVDGLLRPKP